MITLLDYHKATTDYFKQYTAIWDFFANHNHREEQLKDFKQDLLKNTYKFDEATEVALYSKVNLAKEKLNLTIPVIIYQAENIDDINATIVYVNNEAHIVFSGKLLQVMTDTEVLAIIAHELSHVQLYTQLGGEAEVADRIISAIANHHGSTPAHYETARLFNLYTEIFCDRGAYLVTGDYAPIISSLVKISTGLNTVNADSYIKQAEEIFDADAATKTSGISHPENFIRARAIWLWHQNGDKANEVIKQMIEGNINLDELDLFKQQKISFITEQMIGLILAPMWMRTEQTERLAKDYFPKFSFSEIVGKQTLSTSIENLHTNIHDYLAYILYDFATCDKALEDVPMGYCFWLADELKLVKSFSSAVKKERKLTDKKMQSLKKQCLASYHEQDMQLN